MFERLKFLYHFNKIEMNKTKTISLIVPWYVKCISDVQDKNKYHNQRVR